MLRFAVLIPFVAIGIWAQGYYPGPHDDWQRKTPAEAGFDPGRLAEAISTAKAHESKAPRDLKLSHDFSFGREMYGEALGPFRPRGEMTGIILRGGYLVAEWGEPERVDMTFSVAKSFVSTTVGLALKQGLIRSIHDPVNKYITTGEFDGPMNSKITWDHLLRQTSDWEGTLWGKPDWADQPPGRESGGRVPRAQTQRTGDELQVQRRAGEFAGFVRSAGLAPAAAAGAEGADYGSNRGVEHLALAGL